MCFIHKIYVRVLKKKRAKHAYIHFILRTNRGRLPKNKLFFLETNIFVIYRSVVEIIDVCIYIYNIHIEMKHTILIENLIAFPWNFPNHIPTFVRDNSITVLHYVYVHILYINEEIYAYILYNITKTVESKINSCTSLEGRLRSIII